ncbi:hypothetical protein SHELI_v1c06080 [Spiroplasma helicoides]|uniref:Motility-associated protein Scm1 n=1 Tax=Spiroplasma helicoides TaxID=216938 RepID=A0A1B3SKU8_9MOLU|nr:motility-associated protein Scm1 [Spiroplasma helicoides]AOG60559.1 hypothetical protein SHELI_v1c06080 [Spiroplasma helicoides]
MRRHKISFSFMIISTAIFFSLIVACFIIASSVNVDDEFNRIKEYSSSSEIFNFAEKCKSHISNKLDLAYFIMGVEGLSTMTAIHSFSAVVLTLLWAFIIPIFGIIFGVSALQQIILIFIEKIRREYEYRNMYITVKILLIVFISLFSLFALIGIITTSIIENSLNSVDSDMKNYLTFLNGNSSHHIFSYLTAYKYFIDGGINEIMKNGFENSNINNPGDLHNNLVGASAIISAVIMPLLFAIILLILPIFLASIISNRDNSSSRFSNWLHNLRIDSKKEYWSNLIKNPWFWIAFIVFVVSIIFPGFIHPYKNQTQIFITIFAALILPLGFIPLIIAYMKIVKIRVFNYNKTMFNQIIIFNIAIIFIQLNYWILFREEMTYPVWVSLTWPFISIFLSLISLVGFTRTKK